MQIAIRYVVGQLLMGKFESILLISKISLNNEVFLFVERQSLLRSDLQGGLDSIDPNN